MKEKYYKVNKQWHNINFYENPIKEYKWFTDNEALLLNLGKETEGLLLKRNHRKVKLQLIIIDGVDGVGKTTIVENLIREFIRKGFKVRYNTFKRRRGDNKLFKNPNEETEWIF